MFRNICARFVFIIDAEVFYVNVKGRSGLADILCGTKRGILYLMKKKQTEFLKLCLADGLIKLMQTQDFDAINVNAVCKEADIGRTTFYRYFDNKNSKEDLLIFKIRYEWERYAERHEEEVTQDKGFALTNFIYENRRLFSLLYRSGLGDLKERKRYRTMQKSCTAKK